METYEIFKDLAIIILFAKFFGILARKFKAPQVVGEIIAGLIIGPSVLGLVQQTEFISSMAEIGVVLLMFISGLGTNLNELKKVGPKSFIIATVGVFVPLLGGTLLYMAFYGAAPIGSEKFLKALFIGTIMTATSVSITVETLREMGKLKGEIGTTILSAAIIDDIIGIIVLSFVIGFKDPASKPLTVIGNTVMFFSIAIVCGYIIYKIFKMIDKRYPHKRRIPIIGLALSFVMAYVAEKYFGIADITGAYIAGIILCSLNDSEFIAEQLDVNSYILFAPVFFASIGLKTEISDMNLELFLFSLAFVVVALLTKIIGCGGISLLLGYRGADCLKIGVGMMTRGEVALIVAQKGLSVGIIEPKYFTSVILLIIISSIATPLILKGLFAKDQPA
jgi:Kef-type K+ transport system membrane component KefB